MNLINKLGKSLLAALLLTGAATIVSCGSDDSDDGPKLGELKAIFSSDNFSVEAGGTVSLPFTVTGVQGRHCRSRSGQGSFCRNTNLLPPNP